MSHHRITSSPPHTRFTVAIGFSPASDVMKRFDTRLLYEVWPCLTMVRVRVKSHFCPKKCLINWAVDSHFFRCFSPPPHTLSRRQSSTSSPYMLPNSCPLSHINTRECITAPSGAFTLHNRVLRGSGQSLSQSSF